MAAAAAHDQSPLKRSSCYVLPPFMSELRVVLLGSSWSDRSSVGDFILGETVFNQAPESCLRISGTFNGKKVAVINTPDLIHPSTDKLTEFIKNCQRQSAPGPHVFLLLLQPEDFTEGHKETLCRVLELFGDQSFDHSLVLISTPREESLTLMETENPQLKDMIERCGCRYLKQENLEHSELLTLLSQTGKKNHEEHLSYGEDTTAALAGDGEETQTPMTAAVQAAGIHGSSPQITPQCSVSGENPPPPSSDFRIVLLGKSEDKKTQLGNFIIGHQGFQHHQLSPTRHCVASCGEWRGKSVTVVKTPDMLSLSEKNMRREVKSCVSLCPPGPNVLLLLVKPSDFTEEERETLKFILSLFGSDVFKYSMVVITHEQEMDVPVKKLLRDSGGRHYNMFKEDHKQLMEQIEKIVDETRGTFLTFTAETIKPKAQLRRRALNLVLCGCRGSEKTSAAKAILDDAALPSHWDDMKGDIVKLFPVTLGSNEYKHVEAELKKTSLAANIISIEQVQNTTLWQSYQLMKKQMEVKNKHTNNERLLFHGTSSKAIHLINKQGFNRSYAGAHGVMFGSGSYFAVDPVYSARSYATPDTNGHRRIYQARVLVGDFIQGRRGLISPPSKSSTNAADLYDSVCDDAMNPTMFVIFNDIQAYPEYLITFT